MVRVLAMGPETWREARSALAAGMIVAFPTDTVYGVACDPTKPESIQRLYAVKGRDREKAIPLLLSSDARLGYAAREVPPAAQLLGRAFWPGALTLVVPRRPELPEELSGTDTIAVRVPDHPELLNFLEECGGALATTSANLSGRPEALSAQQVADYLGAGVAVIVDGGPSPGGGPSTVVNCSVEPPQVLRVGAISRGAIQAALEGRRE